MRALAKKGQITNESLIRKENGTWVPATSIKNLFKNETEPQRPKTNRNASKIAPPPLPNQSQHHKPVQNPPTNSTNTFEDQEKLEDEEKESNGKPKKVLILSCIATFALAGVALAFFLLNQAPSNVALQNGPPPGVTSPDLGSDQKKQTQTNSHPTITQINTTQIGSNTSFGGYANFGTLYLSSRSEIWNATIVKLKLPLGTKLISGDEAETFAGVLAKNINAYLAKAGAPEVFVDRSAVDLIQKVSPTACRYKLHVGTANKITEADPFAGSDDIILDAKEITESPEAQKCLHILIFDGTILCKNSTNSKDTIFQVEGLDEQNKILSTGLLKTLENPVANSPSKCKFFLPMESPRSVDSLRSIRVAMYADSAFLAFEKNMKSQIASGDLANLALTMEKMDRKWTWRAREVVSENLGSKSPTVRAASAYCLGLTLDKEKASKENFIKLFNDNESVVRETVIKAACRINLTETEGVGLAKSALTDPSASVQTNGIFLYSKHREADAAGYLDSMLKLIEEAKPQVQSLVANELEKPGIINKKLLPILNHHLSSKSPELLSLACRLRGSLGEDGALGIPELSKVLENENPLVVSEAIKSLAKIGPKASPSINKLEKLCDSENITVRKSALESLPKISRSASSISVLINSLADPNQEIANHAVNCLRSMNPPLGPTDLKAVVDKFENPSDKIRIQAYEVLSQVGKADNSLIPWSLKGLEDSNYQINLLCIKYLADQSNLESETLKAMAKILDNYMTVRKEDDVKIVTVHRLSE